LPLSFLLRPTETLALSISRLLLELIPEMPFRPLSRD
jgi:hypothetical protein